MTKQRVERESERSTRIWLWEVWLDNRDTAKLIVGDSLIFFLLMGVVSVGHQFITQMPIAENKEDLCGDLHFGIIVLVWVCQSLKLLAEIFIASVKRIRSRIKSSE